MWHGSAEDRAKQTLEGHRLEPTADAFRQQGFDVFPCVYHDGCAAEVEKQLLGFDAVQVWVNPITEDGHDRTKLDTLLRGVAEDGVFVSSHPNTILKMGTKTVVFDTKGLSWGSDVHLIHSLQDMADQLKARLPLGPRVLKQHRGHSGQGIWKITSGETPSIIKVKPATRSTPEVEMTLEDWVQSCGPYLAQGPMLDQAYNPLIEQGMVRAYLVGGCVEGFGFQEVNALVMGKEPTQRTYSGPDDDRFQDLKIQLEGKWIPELMRTLDLSHDDLPMLWDTDFMFREGGGHMLCEINVSCVYPYPESAMIPLARAFRQRLTR